MLSIRFRVIVFLWICASNNAIGAPSDFVSNLFEVQLNKPIMDADRMFYSEFIHINKTSSLRFSLINKNSNISFIVFQVHSHQCNVTVFNNTLIEGSYVSGSNVGLYSPVKPKIDTFNIMNSNNFDIKVLVTVLGYRDKDPIPGGCNMEYAVPTAPYMRTYNEKDYILVDAAPPRYYSDKTCMSGSNITVEFYMLYLPARALDADTYYSGIKKMMTLDSIRNYGDRIPNTSWIMRRMLSLYSGMGTVYVAVAFNAKNPEHYSVYVPIHDYACWSPGDGECDILDDILSRFICASLIFVGLFTCYLGHRYFKTEMFLFGMLSGVIITYILISIMADLDRPALISASVLSGLLFGAIWVTFWWFYGIPVVAVSLPALNLGFLIASIIYNKIPDDVFLLQLNFNFWTLFVLIMLLASIMLVSVAFISNILCCAVLGAYAVVYPIDFYLGSNLKYLIINTVRRATVPKFNLAVLNLPFEWRDALMIVLWVGLALSGFLFQHYHNRERSPFPPPPRSVRPGTPDRPSYQNQPRNGRLSPTAPIEEATPTERTPLLA